MAEKIHKQKFYTLLFLAVCFLVAIWSWVNPIFANKEHQYQATISALTAGMNQYRNALNQQVTEKQVIIASYKTLQAVHAHDSTEIGKLKKLVRPGTRAGVVISTSTSGTFTSQPTVVHHPSPETCNPTYSDTISDKYSTHSYKVNKDSGEVTCQVKNVLSFKQEDKKEGKWPFRHKVPYVTAVNENTNTITTGIAAYAVAVPNRKKQNTFIGIVSLITGVLIGFKLSN